MHERQSPGDADECSVLVMALVLEFYDALMITRLGQPLRDCKRRGRNRVPDEYWVREANVGETEVRYERALCQRRNAEPDDCRKREHAVHQSCPELRACCIYLVKVQALCVHRQRGEEDVVSLSDSSMGTMPVRPSDLEFFEP